MLQEWKDCLYVRILAGSTGQRSAADAEARRLSIQRCIHSLVHACQCRDANCRQASCQKMKRVMAHTRNCRCKTNGGCPVCKQLIALCCYHAKHCGETKCPVPFCITIKQKLQQQHLQQRMAQAHMMSRRMASTPQTLYPPTTTDNPSKMQQRVAEKQKTKQVKKKLNAAQKQRIKKMKERIDEMRMKTQQLMVRKQLERGDNSAAVAGGAMAVQQSQATPASGAASSSQADLQKLVRVLRLPSSSQQQKQRVVKVLKSHPHLMVTFLAQRRQRKQLMAQK